MKTLIKILSATACVALLNACKAESGGGSTAVFGDNFQIAFYSPRGTNIIDSLKLLKDANFKIYDIPGDFLTASLTRESNGITTGPVGSATQNQSESLLWLPSRVELQKGVVGVFPTDMAIVPEIKALWEQRGSYLSIHFGDMNYSSSYGSKNKEQDEAYTFRLVSKPLFGDENTHVFRLYYHIDGAIGEFYKCEIDGKDMAIQSDRLYSLMKEYNAKAYPTRRRVSASEYIVKLNVGQ